MLRGPCLLSVLGFASLMRFMVESLYVHTTLTLVFVVATYHLLRGNRGTFLAYSAFCVLTKGGLVLVAFLLGIGLILGVRKRSEIARSAAMAATVAVVLGVAVLAFGWATGSLEPWREDLFGDDYVDRFGLLGKALSGDWASAGVVGRAGWELTKHVLASGGLVAVVCLLGADRVSKLLVAMAALFHGLICASDPAFESWGYRVLPLNYFTPAAPLLVVAGIRSLWQLRSRQWSRWVAVGLLPPVIAGVMWCHCRSRAYRLSPRMAGAWKAMHAACVSDSLLRRAESMFGGGDPQAPESDAERVLWLCSRHKMDHRLTYQKGKAHYVLARCAMREGDAAEARAQLKAMLDTSPRFAEVYRRGMQQLGK